MTLMFDNFIFSCEFNCEDVKHLKRSCWPNKWSKSKSRVSPGKSCEQVYCARVRPRDLCAVSILCVSCYQLGQVEGERFVPTAHNTLEQGLGSCCNGSQFPLVGGKSLASSHVWIIGERSGNPIGVFRCKSKNVVSYFNV